SRKGSSVIDDRDPQTPAQRSTAPAQAPDVFAKPDAPKPDVFAKPESKRRDFSHEAMREPPRRQPVDLAFDPAAIMASVGEVPYDWSIASDGLAWGPNATKVLTVGSLAAISSGRSYAKLLAPDTATSRFDAVMKSTARDDGAGVPYQVQYALQPAGADG